MRFRGQAAFLCALALLSAPVSASAADVEMTFYGNQHFKFVTPGGKVILVDPWVKGNPDWPKEMKLEDIKKVDAIFVSGGHADDMGQADEIAKQSGATITPRPSSAATSSRSEYRDRRSSAPRRAAREPSPASGTKSSTRDRVHPAQFPRSPVRRSK